MKKRLPRIAEEPPGQNTGDGPLAVPRVFFHQEQNRWFPMTLISGLLQIQALVAVLGLK